MNNIRRSKKGIKSQNESKKGGAHAEQHEIRRAKAPKTEEKEGKAREKTMIRTSTKLPKIAFERRN